ncbi:BID domain-containing T4SS effector [Bartonella sp. CB178]|uniref:BID domain-containing T4SS effector n=1 Tax=Bartonella sp. CB178 TaxID=3112255 RepID=UPI00300E60F5
MVQSQHTQEAHQENYLYQGSNVLKNKYGVTDSLELIQRSKPDVEQAAIELRQEPLPDQFDISYLMHIHHCLFKNTFEWAGRPRYMRSRFDDGSVAVLKEMKPTESGISYVNGDELQNTLLKIDYTLAKKNNLQDLSRTEFVKEIAEMLSSLNRTHLFVAGNQRTQEIFFERLAEKAGHNLDFSLVTQTHMNDVRNIAAKYGDIDPMAEMLNGISDPRKIPALREFKSKMENMVGAGVQNRVILGANEGRTYQGIYQGTGEKYFALKVGETYIVSAAEDLTPEQRKNLRVGDLFTFTAPKAIDVEKVLIPSETIPNLTKEQIAENVAQDAFVKSARKRVECFAEQVYGVPNLFEKTMNLICKDPSAGERLPDQIENNPTLFHSLAGFNLFGYKTNRRLESEENIGKLSDAIKAFVDSVKTSRQEVIEKHQAEQARCRRQVDMPSNELKEILDLPKELQQEALREFPTLRKELDDLMKQINNRLSQREHKTIVGKACEEVINAIGVPENKAKEIIKIVSQTKEALGEGVEKIQAIKLQRSSSNAMSMIS